MTLTVLSPSVGQYLVELDAEAEAMVQRIAVEKSDKTSYLALLDDLLTKWLKAYTEQFLMEDFQKLPLEKRKTLMDSVKNANK